MIQYPPPVSEGHREWAGHNWQHHQGIILGLKQKYGVDAPLLRIWPWQGEFSNDWLQQHQQMHSFMCGVLGIPGSDLSSVDYKDKRQLDSFFFQHFIEHQAAASRLGLDIL
jgi:hypothetical protein